MFDGYAVSTFDILNGEGVSILDMFDGEGASIRDVLDEGGAGWGQRGLSYHTVDYGTCIKSQLAQTQLNLSPREYKFDHVSTQHLGERNLRSPPSSRGGTLEVLDEEGTEQGKGWGERD